MVEVKMAMGQLLYTLVAKGTVVLAENSCSKGNFRTIARQGLESNQHDFPVVTSSHGNFRLNCLFDNGFAYMLLADKDVTRQVIFSFLEEVKGDFQMRYGDNASTLPALSLDEAYGPELEAHMKKANKSLLCRLLALPEALLLEIILKSASSAPTAPFVWRSLCSKLRRMVSLQNDHLWKRCFIAAFGEWMAFEATSEQLHSALSTGPFSLRLTCLGFLRYAERLVAGGGWKKGRGKERSVDLDAIKEALIACDKASAWSRVVLNENTMILTAMKLESNLLFLALNTYTCAGCALTLRISGCPIVIWNLEDRAVQSICVGHEYVVKSLEVDRWGTMLLSGGHSEIRVWDVASGRCLCSLSSLRYGPWGDLGSLKNVHWVDPDGGVAYDGSTGAPIPKKRVIEEFEEWDQRTGASRRRSAWPALSAPADAAAPAPGEQQGHEYWGPEGEQHTLLGASLQTVLGCMPRDCSLVAREGLSLEEGVLHWLFISDCDEMLPGKLATVWTASPGQPIPHPTRRFKHSLCYDKRTLVIALQGSSPHQVHLADVITGRELQRMCLSTGRGEANESADVHVAEFSHSDSLGWCLVLLLESNLLLVADIANGHSLVRLQCGPDESFYSLSPNGRIFTLKCPWEFVEPYEDLPPARQFSLVDVETQSSSRFEDLRRQGTWVPIQVKNLVGGDPSATSIWMGPGNATVLLWTGPGHHVGTFSLASSPDGDEPVWCPESHKMCSNWRWLVIHDFSVLRIWDMLLRNNSQGS